MVPEINEIIPKKYYEIIIFSAANKLYKLLTETSKSEQL